MTERQGYHVAWAIELPARSPEDAAVEAFLSQRRPGVGATRFEVSDSVLPHSVMVVRAHELMEHARKQLLDEFRHASEAEVDAAMGMRQHVVVDVGELMRDDRRRSEAFAEKLRGRTGASRGGRPKG